VNYQTISKIKHKDRYTKVQTGNSYTLVARVPMEYGSYSYRVHRTQQHSHRYYYYNYKITTTTLVTCSQMWASDLSTV